MKKTSISSPPSVTPAQVCGHSIAARGAGLIGLRFPAVMAP
jgi:hypothetical protein